MKIKPINIIIIVSSVIIISCLLYVFLMDSRHKKIQARYSAQDDNLLEYEETKNFINSRITEIEESVQGFRVEDIGIFIDTLLKYNNNSL
jgi:hypothetical protein